MRVRPTGPDLTIARAIARRTAPAPELVARGVSWGGDEKLLLVIAAAGWLATRGRGEAVQRAGNHALLVTVAASLLPHGLKGLFNQVRPDRWTVQGHFRGIPFSGKPEDSFPSGHALHMGALASAVGPLPPTARRAARALAIGLSLTRIAVLAHWASDVIVGFALGAAIERILRLWTGYPAQSSGSTSVPRKPSDVKRRFCKCSSSGRIDRRDLRRSRPQPPFSYPNGQRKAKAEE